MGGNKSSSQCISCDQKLEKKIKKPEWILKCNSNDNCYACIGLCKTCWDDNINDNLKQVIVNVLQDGTDEIQMTSDVQEATVAFLKIRKEVPECCVQKVWEEALAKPMVRAFLNDRTARRVMRNVTTPKEHWLANPKVMTLLMQSSTKRCPRELAMQIRDKILADRECDSNSRNEGAISTCSHCTPKGDDADNMSDLFSFSGSSGGKDDKG